MKISSTPKLKYKDFSVAFELKAVDTESPYHEFEAYASTFHNVDDVGDAVQPGAFNESLKRRKPSLFFMHQMDMPVGVIDTAYEDSKGLLIKGRLPKNDAFVRDRLHPQIEIGGIASMSIGYSVLNSERSGDFTKLTELELYEVSFVTIPANPQATLDRFKGATFFEDLPLANRGREWNAAEAVQRVREFSGSTESPSPSYKRAFLWFDEESPQDFGSYKLPFADVVDGELTAVPQAVFSAAAAVRGARGGLNIPEDDKDAVISHIESYYDEMDMRSPFKSIGAALSTAQDLKTVEAILTSREGISRRDAKAIISEVKRVSKLQAAKKSAIENAKRDAQAEEPVDLTSIFNQHIKELTHERGNQRATGDRA